MAEAKHEKKTYDRYWRGEIKKGDRPLPKGALREEYIVDYLSNGERLLDVGCGTGAIVEFARERYTEIHGVDISADALKMAKKRGVQTKLCNLNSQQLPYKDDYFDTVVSLDVIEHIFDPHHFMRECRRVLRMEER